MNPYYTDYSEFLGRLFPGVKVQKLSVDGGFTCPNRDGTLSRGGCLYCDNRSFSPEYTRSTPDIAAQIAAGRRFFGRKYPEMRYLAYFQTHTNTYAPVEELRRLYLEALAQPDVVGLIVSTRPDCVGEEVTGLLSELSRQTVVIVELGAETSHDATLSRINRHHTWHDVTDAVARLHAAGLHIGLHLIFGLPGEREEDMLETVRRAAALPVDTLKLHQLQIIRGTALAAQWAGGTDDTLPFTAEEYLRLCAEVVKLVPRRVAIERFVSQSPPDLLLHPRWNLKNYEFSNRLLRILQEQSR